MKSFEQIAQAMYRKWQAALIRFRKPMPFHQLEAHEQQAWIAAAQVAQPQADARDAERLDWLVCEGNAVVQEGSVGFWVCWIDGENSARDEYQLGEYPTAREAIDAAIAAAKENK